MDTFRSDISNKQFPNSEKISGRTIRRSIFDLIKKDYPQFSRESSISLSELNRYREMSISRYLEKEIGELSELEKKVIDSVNNSNILSDKIDGDENRILTVGQKIADNVASFGGSWTFIISFAVFIFIWISINIFFLASKGFDPYPFILLNLILSCLAAL